MATAWLGKTAAIGLIAVLTARSATAQMRQSITAEAARIASDQPLRVDASAKVSHHSSSHGTAKRRAIFGAAFGLIGMIVSSQVADSVKRGEWTSGQALGVLGATGGGVAFGIWLGGR